MTNTDRRPRMSWGIKLLLLFAGMAMALFVVALMLAPLTLTGMTGTATQIITIVLQNIVVFILPVALLAFYCRRLEGTPMAVTMWTGKAPTWRGIALVVAVYVAALPAMNWLVDWNSQLHLPQSLQHLEKLMREMEDAAQQVTEAMLSTSSWGKLVVLVLTVGVLTAMGEEAFFRAGVLGTMRRGGVNTHVAIWTAAFVFSAIHMQFYGFVPRLLLGAWFGYLMLWSGEVWTPIIAHALNNAMVVVFTFLVNNHFIDTNVLDTVGVPQSGQFPAAALASAVVTAIIIIFFFRKKSIS